MKNLIEKFFKSVWIPFVLFVVIAILGIICAALIYPHQDLFYTNKVSYNFWKSASIIVRQSVIWIAGMIVFLSVIYKIRNRMLVPLFYSVVIFVLVFGIQNYIKRGVGGRFVDFEEVDRDIRGDLKQFASKLEDFKADYGHYPSNLEEIRRRGFHYQTIFPNDKNGRPLFPEDWPIHYQVSEDGQDYDLRSGGVDFKLGTVDDIVWKLFNSKSEAKPF